MTIPDSIRILVLVLTEIVEAGQIGIDCYGCCILLPFLYPKWWFKCVVRINETTLAMLHLEFALCCWFKSVILIVLETAMSICYIIGVLLSNMFHSKPVTHSWPQQQTSLKICQIQNIFIMTKPFAPNWKIENCMQIHIIPASDHDNSGLSRELAKACVHTKNLEHHIKNHVAHRKDQIKLFDFLTPFFKRVRNVKL